MHNDNNNYKNTYSNIFFKQINNMHNDNNDYNNNYSNTQK